MCLAFNPQEGRVCELWDPHMDLFCMPLRAGFLRGTYDLRHRRPLRQITTRRSRIRTMTAGLARERVASIWCRWAAAATAAYKCRSIVHTA